MKIIRKGVFEINSSSCHSVSVAEGDTIFDTIVPDEDGNIVIIGGEFGRFFKRSNDTLEKASYALTSTEYGLSKEVLEEVIKEQTLCDSVEFILTDDHYIDHESVGVCPRDKEELRKFIFDKNSWLFVAHDEGTPEIGFYDVLPIYTKDGVIEPKYSHKFTIPITDYGINLVEYPNDDVIKEIISSLKLRFVKDDGGNIVEDGRYNWCSWKTYYETDYHIEQNFDENYIFLVNKDSYRHISSNREIGWDAQGTLIRKFIFENLDNMDVCFKLEYKIENL
jgi:hypothetical protein